MPTPAPSASITDRLNALPITGLHKRFVAIIGISMFFDVYELFLTSVLVSTLKKHFDVPAELVPLVLASTFIGAFLGAAVFGRIADRIGRRRALMITIALYSLFSLLGAFSTSAWMLIVTRVIAGIGLGGEYPVTNSYMGDILPARQRGRYMAWAFTLSYLGVPLVGFLGVWLVEHSLFGVDGWRIMFVIGALGAAIVWILRNGMPESPRWLAANGRHAQAHEIVARFERAAGQAVPPLAAPAAETPTTVPSVRESFGVLLRRPMLSRFLLMASVSAFYVFGYYGFGSLVPLILVAKGQTIINSVLYSAMSFIGYPIGSALSIPLMERFQRKAILMGSAAVMVAAGLGFGFSSEALPVVVCGLIYTLASNVMSNAYHIFMSEQFPTALRGTAIGWCYSLSRLSTAAVPFILLPFMNQHGPTALLLLVAGIMAAIVAAVGLFGVRTTGRGLEDINADAPAPAAALARSAGVSAPR